MHYNLQKKVSVWDIGTCTGSMAIEAAKLAPEGQVFAIEKNEPDLENCFQNQRSFEQILQPFMEKHLKD